MDSECQHLPFFFFFLRPRPSSTLRREGSGHAKLSFIWSMADRFPAMNRVSQTHVGHERSVGRLASDCQVPFWSLIKGMATQYQLPKKKVPPTTSDKHSRVMWLTYPAMPPYFACANQLWWRQAQRTWGCCLVGSPWVRPGEEMTYKIYLLGLQVQERECTSYWHTSMPRWWIYSTGLWVKGLWWDGSFFGVILPMVDLLLCS